MYKHGAVEQYQNDDSSTSTP